MVLHVLQGSVLGPMHTVNIFVNNMPDVMAIASIQATAGCLYRCNYIQLATCGLFICILVANHGVRSIVVT